MQITGACHCKAVRFSADIDPSRVMLCHCTDCQVMSGSAFRIVVVAPIETFVVEGLPKGYLKVADSGNRRVQAFCPECGAPLYAMAPEGARTVSIRLGCIDQRAQLKPAAQIWRHSALPWLTDISGVPASPEEQELRAPSLR